MKDRSFGYTERRKRTLRCALRCPRRNPKFISAAAMRAYEEPKKFGNLPTH